MIDGPDASPDVVPLTRRWLGFNTVNPPGDERACAHFIAGLLNGAAGCDGPRRFVIEDNMNVEYQHGPRPRRVLSRDSIP